jgi:hypothetical protein
LAQRNREGGSKCAAEEAPGAAMHGNAALKIAANTTAWRARPKNRVAGRNGIDNMIVAMHLQ